MLRKISWALILALTLAAILPAVLAESYVAVVTLNVQSMALMPDGEGRQLTVQIEPAEASGERIYWMSSNSSVASVDNSGMVTPHAVGTTTITAETAGGISDACVVTVTSNPATSISLSKTELVMGDREAYVLDALIQGVETELNYIAENLTEPDEIRDAVQAMDTESLKEAMTADGSTVTDTLAAVEQTAGGSADVRVEEAVTAFDADKISVIGANLHTPENAESPIALVIGAPQQETGLDTVYDSDAAVAISMTLENAGVEDILAVPVEITLPVPAHLNVEYLVVLHYLYDGSLELPELEVFRQDDQWYVSFVVTSLGDFVLTQYAETIAARGTSGSISWQLSSWGNLNISGTGAMTDYESAKGTPWAIYSADICAVIVEEGVTHVGAFAFCGCENLETVTLASTVETIGEAAFVCSGITEFRVAEESTILTAQDGILYSADMTALIAYPGGKTDAVMRCLKQLQPSAPLR